MTEPVAYIRAPDLEFIRRDGVNSCEVRLYKHPQMDGAALYLEDPRTTRLDKALKAMCAAYPRSLNNITPEQRAAQNAASRALGEKEG